MRWDNSSRQDVSHECGNFHFGFKWKKNVIKLFNFLFLIQFQITNKYIHCLIL